jgi:four helix bundle protein
MIQDLHVRTRRFASEVRALIKVFPQTISTLEDAKQIVRSSGSVGANYIEAGEAVSRQDELFRLRICKKEAKESIYWLDLLKPFLPEEEQSKWNFLKKEATELVLIFSTIVAKLQQKP